MLTDRIKMLNDIGFVWRSNRWMGKKLPWSTRYNELVAYKEKHGHCSVPSNERSLVTWIKHQRADYASGKMSKDRIKMLNAIDFGWGSVKKRKVVSEPVSWSTRYNELVAYREKHGHCNVPTNLPLARWICMMRSNYNKDKLSKNRKELLDKIGFDFKSPLNPWISRYHELVKYKDHHGHCNVPQSDGSLGTWVHHMRRHRKLGKISDERIKLLDKIGFVWSMR
jgi:hypothetical protein